MTLFFDKQARKFVIGVWLGLAFSIGVILCTIGLMDGFIFSLKEGLKSSNGDISITSDQGFFNSDKNQNLLKKLGVSQYTSLILSEGFVVSTDQSTGVSVIGVEPARFMEVTGMKIPLKPGHLVLGKVLSENLNTSIGNEIVLALANGNKESSELPQLSTYPISGIVEHNIYEKDSRTIYILLDELQQILNAQGRVNSISLNIPRDFKNELGEKFKDTQTEIEEYSLLLEGEMGLQYRVKPYWYDFSYLLEAVKIEKTTIGLILQVIVLISIFNVIAFMKFLNERKAREFFLYRALGMSQKVVNKLWIMFVLFIWILSCSLSLVFVEFFKWGLQNIDFLKLPGDVYYLASLDMRISLEEIVSVFMLALMWMVIAYGISIWRIKKKSLLYGLRKEFN